MIEARIDTRPSPLFNQHGKEKAIGNEVAKPLRVEIVNTTVTFQKYTNTATEKMDMAKKTFSFHSIFHSY